MKRAWVLTLLAVAAAHAIACQMILGLDKHELAVAPDATPDAASAACPFAHRPVGPPNVPDSDVRKTYVFAARSVDFSGKGPSGEVIGYDLDGVCTCDPRDTSARAGKPSCRAPAKSPTDGGCDNDGGIDNVTAADPVVGAYFSDAGTVDHEAECGRSTMLIIVQDYNGQADDPEVLVSAMPSFGIIEGSDASPSPPDCESGAARIKPAFAARWDGTDPWSTRSEDVDPGTGKPRSTYAGWVNQFELVLDSPSTSYNQSLAVLLREATVEFATPILTGTLVPLDGGSGFRLDNGILAGRISANDMLDWVGAKPIDLSLSPTGLSCDSPIIYDQALKPVICSLTDTLIPASGDFQPFPCNALSVALSFRAEPATLGTVQYDLGVSDASCTANPAKRCDGQ